MKIKEDFVLRQVDNKWIAVCVSDEQDANKLFITLNDVGAFVFKILEQETTYEDIINAVTSEYEVSYLQAQADLDKFLDTMRTYDILQE